MIGQLIVDLSTISSDPGLLLPFLQSIAEYCRVVQIITDYYILAFFYDFNYSRSRLRQIRVQPSQFKELPVSHLSFLECQHCYTHICLFYALILSSRLVCKLIQNLFNLPGFHYSCVCFSFSASSEEIALARTVFDVGSCQGDQAGGGGGQQELGQTYLAVFVDMKDSAVAEEVLDHCFPGGDLGRFNISETQTDRKVP